MNNRQSATQIAIETDWAISGTLNDDQILAYTDEIISNPSCTLSTGNVMVEEDKLYSKSQMLEMFKSGYFAMTRARYIRRTKNIKERAELPRPYSVLRNMNVGEKKIFPYESWKAVRVAASQFGKSFGSKFKVTKVAPRNKKGSIEVIRLS